MPIKPQAVNNLRASSSQPPIESGINCPLDPIKSNASGCRVEFGMTTENRFVGSSRLLFEQLTEGFTLVEIIASLLLVGVLASIAGLFIITGVQGYETAVTASEGALKAQIAMKRIYLEVSGINPDLPIPEPTSTSITYHHSKLTPDKVRIISFDSNQRRINLTVDANTYPLIDDIETFAITTSKKDLDNDTVLDQIAYVDIVFSISGIGGEFKLNVYPRNILPVS